MTIVLGDVGEWMMNNNRGINVQSHDVVQKVAPTLYQPISGKSWRVALRPSMDDNN